MPTVAELLGLAVPDGLDGRSLVPYLEGEAPPAPPVFAESGQSFHPALVRGRVIFGIAGRLRTVIDGRWKLVWTPGQDPQREFALYDLETDPGETRDVSASHPAETARLRDLLRGRRRQQVEVEDRARSETSPWGKVWQRPCGRQRARLVRARGARGVSRGGADIKKDTQQRGSPRDPSRILSRQ